MLFLFCQYREKKSGKDVRLKDEQSQSVNGHKEFSNGKSSEVGKKASQSSRKLRSGKSLGQVMHIISQCFVHFSLFLSVYICLFLSIPFGSDSNKSHYKLSKTKSKKKVCNFEANI